MGRRRGGLRAGVGRRIEGCHETRKRLGNRCHVFERRTRTATRPADKQTRDNTHIRCCRVNGHACVTRTRVRVRVCVRAHVCVCACVIVCVRVCERDERGDPCRPTATRVGPTCAGEGRTNDTLWLYVYTRTYRVLHGTHEYSQADQRLDPLHEQHLAVRVLRWITTLHAVSSKRGCTQRKRQSTCAHANKRGQCNIRDATYSIPEY